MARKRKHNGNGKPAGHGNGGKPNPLRDLQNRVRRLEEENDKLCRSLAMARADCEMLTGETEVMSGVIDTLIDRNGELAEQVAIERARQRYAE